MMMCILAQYLYFFSNVYPKSIVENWYNEEITIEDKILGSWDPTGKEYAINQCIDNLPHLKGNVTVYNDVGHFIEEVKPLEISNTIIQVTNLL